MADLKPTSSEQFPSYKTPPVNEVICGMRFNTPEDLRITHIGRLWEKFRPTYETVKHAQPIISATGELTIDQTTMVPLPRVWFINESDDQLVQFQIDRFYFNWRKRQSEYPRYEYVIGNFQEVLKKIEDFFTECGFGSLKPTEYELTYTNHMEMHREWETIDDLQKMFVDFGWNPTGGRFLPNPNKISWQTEFLLPEDKGHLYVSLKSAIRVEDKVPLIVLDLTARGFSEAMPEWYNMAREWIVRGFTDLTTPEAHKIWEKE